MLRKDKRKEIAQEIYVELQQLRDEGKDTSQIEEKFRMSSVWTWTSRILQVKR